MVKEEGITKTLDNLGRVLIPKDVRKLAGMTIGDELEMSVENGRIILEKKTKRCMVCTSENELLEININNKRQCICMSCRMELQQIESQ